MSNRPRRPAMDIHTLLHQIAAQEDQARSTSFLAPCVKGGQVRTRISGLVLSFRPDPDDFEGWGIFQPQDHQTAQVIETASLPQIESYLTLLKPLRVILVSPLKGTCWLAYPAHEESTQRLISPVRPLLVHLVEGGERFELARARWDGRTCWWQELDLQGDPQLAEAMRETLDTLISPQDLRLTGLTPEHRVAYDLATQGIEGFDAQHQERQQRHRLQQALELGGGSLQGYRDQGEYWIVNWQTADGQHHSSAIQKVDLTVLGAGICLSGRDRDFDLQSLVGVVEGSEFYD